MKLGRPVVITFVLCGCVVGVLWVVSLIGERWLLPCVQQGNRRAIVPADPSYEIVSLRTKDGTKIIGQFGKAEPQTVEPDRDGAHAPTLILFYGKGVTLSRFQGEFDELRAMGVNVFIPEFPGVGMSEGKGSESQYYATADAALDYLLGRMDIDHDRIIAVGGSLGAGTAVDLASRRTLAGLISIGGFTNAPDTLAGVYFWLPRWGADLLMARCRFDNLTKIKSVTCPILLIYGTSDTIVPPEMAERLALAAKGPVTKLPVASSHGSLLKNSKFTVNATVHDWLHAR